jgi:glycosyltransferase involved in cell wall biosynthesis
MNNCDIPFISALMPTYNNGQFIKEAIDSIFAQDYENLEIIVVDDGSTDNTKEIVAHYGETVKYFYQEHSGISAARNLCLEHASGEYIAWLDADDCWVKGKLQAQVKYFEEHPDCQIVFTKFENFFENKDLKSNPIAMREYEYGLTDKFHLTTTLTKREVFEKFGNFSKELVIGEDEDLFHRLRLFGTNINHCLEQVYYRRRFHGENITLTHDAPTPFEYRKYMLQYLKKNAQKVLG